VQTSSGVPPPKQRRAQSPPRSRSPPQSSSKYDQSPHGRLFASSQPSHNDSFDDIISTLPRAAQERAKNMPAHLPPELVVQEVRIEINFYICQLAPEIVFRAINTFL
jgi:hypothetical protein